MDLRVLGPVEASVDGRPVVARRRASRARCWRCSRCTPARRSRPSALIDGLWGEAAAGDGEQDGAGLRVAAAQGAGGRGDGAEIVTRGRGYELRLGAGERRRAPLRAARGRAAPARGARAVARPAARRRRGRAVRRAPRSAGSRSCGSRRSSWRSTSDLAAGRHREVVGELDALVAAGAAARAPARPADAGAVSLRPAGRRARGLPPARARRWSTRSASSPAPSCGGCTRRSCARTRRSTCRRRPSCRRSWRRARRCVGPRRRAASGCASTGAARRAATAGSCWSTGARGIGKTRLAAELAAEVASRRRRTCCTRPARARRCGARGARRAGARRAARAARASTTPTHAAGSRRSPSSAGRWPRTRPVLVLATAQEAPLGADELRSARSPPPRSARSPSSTRTCDEAAGRRSDCSRERRGAPARCIAGRRVGARRRPPASRRVARAAAAAERAELRAAEDELAGEVVELQALRERAEPRERRRSRRLPVQGAGVVRRRRRRVLLRARAARGRDGGAPGGRAADWASSGRRAAASPRRCAPACCRRSPPGCCPAASAGRSRCCARASIRSRALERRSPTPARGAGC